MATFMLGGMDAGRLKSDNKTSSLARRGRNGMTQLVLETLIVSRRTR